MRHNRHFKDQRKEGHIIHPHNNNHDLELIEVSSKELFAIGGTRIGRAADRNWLVHWVDEATLVIAPEHTPTAWTPAHVYSRSGDGNGTLCFTLTPTEREAAQWEALGRVTEIDVIDLKQAIDEVEDQVDLLVADDLDRAPFDGLAQSSTRRANSSKRPRPRRLSSSSPTGPPSTESLAKWRRAVVARNAQPFPRG